MNAIDSLIVFLLRVRSALRAFHRCPGRLALVAHRTHAGAFARH